LTFGIKGICGEQAGKFACWVVRQGTERGMPLPFERLDMW